MAFIIEDGSGVRSANAYMTVAEVLTYLTDRGRETDWAAATTAVQQAAIIESTDYVEQRFAMRFKGEKEYLAQGRAQSVLTLTEQPANTETVTIGSTVYTFNTTIGGAFSVLIGDTISESLDNLVTAINTDDPDGVVVGIGTTEHPDTAAVAFIGLTMLAQAEAAGEDANTTATTTTVTNASWSFTTLSGGNDLDLAQPLSFPRRYLYDQDGKVVLGVPGLLKNAVAEYASRALAATLLADPTVDATGRTVIQKLERVGPIVTDTKYQKGDSIAALLGIYPAADRFLEQYLFPRGSVFRG